MLATDQERWERFFGGRGWHPGAIAARREWLRKIRAENAFARHLRGVAQQIGRIVRGFGPHFTEADIRAIGLMLDQYAELIEPWATRVIERLHAEVARRDAASWHQLGKQINRALRQEIATAPAGPVLAELQASQVELIKSLPLDAAERVHAAAQEMLTAGRRWGELAGPEGVVRKELEAAAAAPMREYEEKRRQIWGTEEWVKFKANLIARTETARVATNLTRVRAEHIGSEGFIWRTVKDRDVRPLHRSYEGKFFPWNDLPILDDGRPGLPGTIWNCRCYPEIVLAGGSREDRILARNPAYLAGLRARAGEWGLPEEMVPNE